MVHPPTRNCHAETPKFCAPGDKVIPRRTPSTQIPIRADPPTPNIKEFAGDLALDT